MACNHRGCNCAEGGVTREGKPFCSERCAEAQTTGRHQSECPCGHDACGSERRAAPREGAERA